MYGEVPEKTDGSDEDHFHAIVYTPSGYTEGVAPWKMVDLSGEFVDFWCDALRDIPQFDDQLPAPFDAVRLRFHTDGKIGVADFFFNDVFFSTSVFLRGKDRTEEKTLIESLVAVAQEQQKESGLKVSAFTEILNAKERPLHCIFVWTYQRDENYEIVPELTNHLAGAFVRGFK
jgi:hypothetical protein